jgi:hypothetical protein
VAGPNELTQYTSSDGTATLQIDTLDANQMTIGGRAVSTKNFTIAMAIAL